MNEYIPVIISLEWYSCINDSFVVDFSN